MKLSAISNKVRLKSPYLDILPLLYCLSGHITHTTTRQMSIILGLTGDYQQNAESQS